MPYSAILGFVGTPGGRKRIVIVGGGFGGLFAAKALNGADADVLIIDRTNHHLFQPLLYQVATAGLSPANIAAPIRSILSRQKHLEVMLAEVEGVDHAAKEVILSDRRVPYDYLILATGVRHSYFGHADWEQYAPGLKRIEDATAMRRKILMAFEEAEMERDPERQRAWLNFVIVGAGPTGVELAGSIAELAHRVLTRDFDHIDPDRTRVLLVEAGPRILATFSEKIAKMATRSLHKLGVTIRTGTRVEQVDGEGVIADGERIASKTVLWAAGVEATPAAKWLEVESDRAGRIPVNPDCSVPGREGVFAIGDIMTLTDEQGKPLPGVCQTAMQQGTYVGKLIKDLLRGRSGHRPFHYRNKGDMATIGRAAAVASIKGFEFGGFFAWVLWLTIHIAYLIGFANRVLTLIQWAWAYVTFQRGARLITHEKHD